MYKLATFLLLFIPFLLSGAEATGYQFDLLPKEPVFCAIDKQRENQNDPCNPEATTQESDKATEEIRVPVTAETPISQGSPSSQKDKVKGKKSDHTVVNSSNTPSRARIQVLFFWGVGCPHCAQQKPFLESLRVKYPEIDIVSLEVFHNKENASLFERVASIYGVKASGVPATFIGDRALIGFSASIARDIEKAIIECREMACVSPLQREMHSSPKGHELKPVSELINIPLIGNIDVSKMTLPMMTVVIAGLDSFNPCAFFVLFSLLGLMIHARSRSKMALIGGIFVFFSGLVYFLFMAAWLNFFLIVGEMAIITTIAGLVALVIAGINIKDFFVFKEGISLTISDEAKMRLFDRMRRLLRSQSIAYIVFGTVVLALAANAYELLCTAGFPMVFTRILTLHNLPSIQYYLYLVLYNLVYVIPLLIIVAVFTATLGKRQLSESQGRFLKLLSGLMMLGLGLALLLRPSLLNNVFISVIFLIGSLFISIIFHYVYRKRHGV